MGKYIAGKRIEKMRTTNLRRMLRTGKQIGRNFEVSNPQKREIKRVLLKRKKK